MPADAKWFRNLVVVEAVTRAMRPYRKRWLATLEEEGKVRRAELAAWRKQRKQRASAG